jgi:glycosyltransferase involved in cell wall biosynthesis
MNSAPLISIAVPSYNQGRFIRETLQSLVAQQYPNLEVIIQDGGSTDGSVEIAREFVENHPGIFQLSVERDSGFAQALNRAFQRTSGEILGYLNTDDILYPGCLDRVAREIEPSRDRYVVFGRCLFTGEDSPYVGVEHPAEFINHFEELAIWKRGYNTLPQPSVFWHRQVWQEYGGFDEKEHHLIDYDLFCRFSKGYRFYKIDELWSTYRMHSSSKSSRVAEPELLARSIVVSRKYWGSWWQPLRWRCEISHWFHGQHLQERARHHARRAEESWDRGRLINAVWETINTARFSPPVAWHRLVQPLLAEKGYTSLAFLLFKKQADAAPGFVGKYADNWVGPVYRQDVRLPHTRTKVVLVLEHNPQPSDHHARIDVSLFIDGRKVARQRRTAPGQFSIQTVVKRPSDKESIVLELRARPYFIPRLLTGAPDDRKLSLLHLETIVKPYGD